MVVYTAPTVSNGVAYDASLWQAALDEIERLSAAVNALWVPYTPVWTAAGTAPALGNGLLTGLWRQTGDTVDAFMRFAPGSTTTYGTSAWKFTLPAAANASSFTMPVGAADCIQTAVTERAATVRCFDSDPARVSVATAGGGLVNATTPHNWANTHELRMSFRYQRV